MKTPASRLRLGLFVLVVLLALRLAPGAGHGLGAWREMRAEARAAREHARTLVQARDAVAARLHHAQERLTAHAGEFLPVEPHRRPEETLALLVAEVADASGLQLEAVSPQAGDAQDRVLVSVDGAGSIDAIGWWLATLEAGVPRLFIDRLQLTVQQGIAREQVRLRATVVGLPWQGPSGDMPGDMSGDTPGAP